MKKRWNASLWKRKERKRVPSVHQQFLDYANAHAVPDAMQRNVDQMRIDAMNAALSAKASGYLRWPY